MSSLSVFLSVSNARKPSLVRQTALENEQHRRNKQGSDIFLLKVKQQQPNAILFMFFLLRFLTLQILAWVKKWPSDRITNKTKKSPNYSGIKDTVEASAGSVRWPLVAYKHLRSHRKIKQKDTCYCLAANFNRRWEAILEGALVKAKTREEAALEG